MATCIIHIGGSKTGSSSIQKSLYANRDLLKQVGEVEYPIINVSNKITCVNHNFISSLFNEFETSQREYKINFSETEFHELRRLYDIGLRQIDSSNVVISSEYLSFFKTEQVSSMKKYLKSIGFNKFIIISYVRDPADQYASAVQQIARAQKWFPLPNIFPYQLRDFISPWSQVFNDPSDRLIVRHFDKNSVVNGCVVTDFLKTLFNCLSKAVETDSFFITNDNASLSIESLSFLHNYQKHHYNEQLRFNDDSRRILECLVSLEGNRITLKNSVRDYIYALTEKDRMWISSEFGIHFGFKKVGDINSLELDKDYSFNLEDVFYPLDRQVYERNVFSLVKMLASN